MTTNKNVAPYNDLNLLSQENIFIIFKHRTQYIVSNFRLIYFNNMSVFCSYDINF